MTWMSLMQFVAYVRRGVSKSSAILERQLREPFLAPPPCLLTRLVLVIHLPCSSKMVHGCVEKEREMDCKNGVLQGGKLRERCAKYNDAPKPLRHVPHILHQLYFLTASDLRRLSSQNSWDASLSYKYARHYLC